MGSDIFGVLLTVVLLAANAFFVGAEFALISARRDRLEALAEQGKKSAVAVIRAGENLSLMLAGAQLGITICSILLGRVGEPAVAHLLEGPFGLLGIPDAVLHTVSFIVALGVVVTLHVLLGEMVPKNIAIAGPESAAMLLIPPYLLYVRSVKPLISFYNWCANTTLRALRVEPKDELDVTVSTVELSEMIAESVSEGLLDPEEHTRLTRALQIRNRVVSDVAVPLAEIRAVPVAAAGSGPTIGAVEKALAETGYSRFPIAGVDGIYIGYLHIKDILAVGDDPDTVVDLSVVRPCRMCRNGCRSPMRCRGCAAPTATWRWSPPGMAGRRYRWWRWWRWRTWWRIWWVPCATERTVSDVTTCTRIVAESDWTTRAAAHRHRAEVFLAPHRRRAAAGEAHPVWDFLFTYYSLRPRHIQRWHPGYGVVLAGPAAREYLGRSGYGPHRDGVTVSAEHLRARLDTVAFVGRLLDATAQRPAQLNCFGLHEWAMVYRSTDVRHNAVPLRLGPSGTDAVVESMPLRCTHFDAFRFFTPDAAPRNATALTRESQVGHEQPGCIHAAMDLYKWSAKLGPLIDSTLLLDCLELAADARELDMRASPYDLTEYGFTAIRIENATGRAEYVRCQSELSQRAASLRSALRDRCDLLLVADTRPDAGY